MAQTRKNAVKRRRLLGLSAAFLGGCATTTQPIALGNGSSGSEKDRTLFFSVTDVQGLEELERDYEPFRVEFADVLQRPVEYHPVEGYTEAASAMQTDAADLVIAGPSEYVLIRARTEAIPLIAITRPNYHSVLVVRGDSPARAPADLKDKTVAMLRVGSTSGHLGPTYMLVQAGLDPKTDYETQMLGTEGSWAALQAGEVDAWGGPFLNYERYLREEGLSKSDFPILEKSPPLPSDVFVVRSGLDPALITLLRDRLLEHQDRLIPALAATPENEKYQSSSFAPVDDSDYDSIRAVYRALGEGNFL